MLARLLLWIGLGIFIAWFINTTQLLDIVVLFLLAGAIPGTRILLPPVVMLVVLSFLLLLAAYWLKRQQLAKQIQVMKAKHEASVRQAPKPRAKKPPAPYYTQLIAVAMLVELHVLPHLKLGYKTTISHLAEFIAHTRQAVRRWAVSLRNSKWVGDYKRTWRQFIQR